MLLALTMKEQEPFEGAALLVVVEVELEAELHQVPEDLLVGVAEGAGQQVVDILEHNGLVFSRP